jgi:hypothetical protein
MAEAEHDTHAKALSINLDPTTYGTFAEIGAGQEVARWFLQAGGASGTVARTVSAYDMTFSDAVYGKVGRYVSRDRLEGMLEYEYALLLERLSASKGATTRFFAFADTISARNFAGTNECHGWVGLRFQVAPGGPPNDVILHVNLLEPANLLQQQAVGILGVNLIFAAFNQRQSAPGFLAGVFQDLAHRLEVDLIALRGPEFAGIDAAAANIELLQNHLAEAVIFPVEGPPVPPSELLRKRPLVLTPGVFAHAEPVHAAMTAAARKELLSEIDATEREPLPLFVLTSRHPGETAGSSTAELASRLDALRQLGTDVLVVAAPEVYRVVRYALRYTTAPIRVVTGSLTVADLLQTRHYDHLDGALMEALAQLFACNVRMYVYPTPAAMLVRLDPSVAAWISAPEGGGMIALEHLVVPPPASHLLAYLVASGFMRPIAAA